MRRHHFISAIATLGILSLSLQACREGEESLENEASTTEASQDATGSPIATPSETTTLTPQNSVAETPSPFPTIADETLLNEARLLPTPAGSTGHGLEGAGFSEHDGVAFLSIVTSPMPEEVLTFYDNELPTLGWSPEGEPEYSSYETPDPDYVAEVVNWSFVKGDLRLTIGAQLNPSHPPAPGLISWVLTVQPEWYPWWKSNVTASQVGGQSP